MRRLFRDIRAYGELSKVRISLFSAFSAATGFLIASPGASGTMIILAAGVFLLSCGSCALNQYQERDIDALMPRTRNRPLPSGRIPPASALLFSCSLLFAGLAALWPMRSTLVPAFGIFAVVWYNGIYTHLKRRTAFALIPGALLGMIPPAMGWAAAGAPVTDHRLLFLCFFFFMWQVPHFWLLILNCGDEYEKAGLPSLTGILTRTQLSRIIFVWIFATAVSSLFVFATGMTHTSAVKYLFGGASLWLLGNALVLFRGDAAERPSSLAFRRINIYMLSIMVLLTIDRLF